MVRPFIPSRRRLTAMLAGAVVVGLSVFFSTSTSRAAGVLRGRITGQDKLIPDAYAEAVKDAHRYTWRDLSPTVRPEFRTLSAMPSRDICIAALTSGTPAPTASTLIRVTGGRITPSTLVVTPGARLVFDNKDPFPHRLVQKDWKAELIAGAQKDWTAPGPGRYEFRDELFPSVRMFVVVDAQVAATTFPNREGAFNLGLPAGEYIIKAFFQGKQVGKQVSLLVRDRAPTDIKEALNVGEGAEQK